MSESAKIKKNNPSWEIPTEKSAKRTYETLQHQEKQSILENTGKTADKEKSCQTTL